MLEIKVLGPLEAVGKTQSIVPTAGKPRQILALLALRAGEVVPVSTLIEEIWGENPPRSALTTMQTYILQLRRLIGQIAPGLAKEVLITRYNGYLLAAKSVRVDAHVYADLAAAANRCYEAGDYAEAARLSRQALTLWSGQVLIDVQKGMPLEIEVTCLEQSRISLLEIRIDAELRLGRHQAVLGELSMLVARNPMHENLCAMLMTALYRSGQQWRALGVFRQLRAALTAELGVEPSARLQRLQHAILTADPSLELPESHLMAQRA